MHQRYAHLVVHIDTKVDPPRLVGAGVYSASATGLSGSIRRGAFAFDVGSMNGASYQEAADNLIRSCVEQKEVYGFALKLLDPIQLSGNARVLLREFLRGG